MSNTDVEIIQIAESIAKEKGLARESIISSMEQAIEGAAKKKYGYQNAIKAKINLNNGSIQLYKLFQVVENPEDTYREINLEDAQKFKQDAQMGDSLLQELPSLDIARVYAQAAKQVMIQTIREAEQDKEYKEFKDRVGDILTGAVKRIEFGHVIVEVGRTEAMVVKDQLLRTDNFRINDRVKAYIKDVKRDNLAAQIQLSRTDNMFLAKLLEIEVPEIEEKTVQIMGIARDPGSRAKVAVFAKETGVDAVGACIGARGSRVKAVSNELNGEKIDLIQWEEDLAKYAINALAPASIEKVIIDESLHKIEVVVSEDQISLAIGKQGQNVRLASKVLGWDIDLITTTEESKRSLTLFNKVTQEFMNDLELDEILAQLLVAEGYGSIEEIANTSPEILSSIEGIDQQIAETLIERASAQYSKKIEFIIAQLEALGVEQSLIDSLELSPDDLLKLANYGVKTLEDLEEVTLNEFKQIISNNVYTDEEIIELINKAKKL